MMAAQQKMMARELQEQELKGKVDIGYYGHAGIRVSFVDANN